MLGSYLDRENQHILTHTKDNSANSFIANVNELVRHVDGILHANTIFNQNIVDVLREALETDFTELLKDLKKGNYLGNRQLDINLLKNMDKWNEYLTEEEQKNIWLDENELVYYDSALVKFIDGTTHRIIFQFDGVEGPITTHGDLLLQLNNDEEFLAKLEKTSANTFPTKVVGEYLKLYDKLGENSNVEGVELNAVRGRYKEKNPYYYWIATTSALQVLAMRSTEIIKLGAHIDKVVSLALNVDQMLELQNRLPQLVDTYDKEGNPKGDVTIYNHLTELLGIYSKLDYLLDVVNLVEAAENNANMAEQFADEALTRLNKMQSIRVGRTVTLAPSQSAEVRYDAQNNTFSFYIPQGVKGERGEPFQINAFGTIAQRDLYDNRPESFSFLDVEAGSIYFKKSSIEGDWTEGTPFGQGIKGENGENGTSIKSIKFTSTTHKSGLPHQSDAIDTYTITLDNGNTEDFKIQNGTAMKWSKDNTPYPINAQVYYNDKWWVALRKNSVEPAAGADWTAFSVAPATTTACGIGRVATLADMKPGAVVGNGPAFLAAGDVVPVIEKWCFVVGEFYYFRHPTLKTGFAAAQGGLISGVYQGKNITTYPIWAYLQTTEGKKLCKTEAQWQAMTTATWATLADGSTIGWNGIGGAPFYVQDLSAGTLRMPDLRGMYAEAAGFDSLGVGGVQGDQGREAAGTLGPFVGGWNSATYGYGVFTQSGQNGTYASSQGGAICTKLSFSLARVVPTGPAFAPRRWGALACCYLGQPA